MLQMINQFQQKFTEVIEGSGDQVSTDQLSVGAKINRLFHERLPLHIGKSSSSQNQVEIARLENLKFSYEKIFS